MSQSTTVRAQPRRGRGADGRFESTEALARQLLDDSASTARPVTRRSLLLLGGLLLLTSLLAFTPIVPTIIPNAGLDHSWRLAMNQAVAQGLVFGRDIIFTFGPYAELFTHYYHPATHPSALLLGALLGLGHGALLLMRLREQPSHWRWTHVGFATKPWMIIGLHRFTNGWLCCYAAFLLLVDSGDALFFSYPLLVALTACMETAPWPANSNPVRFPGRRLGYLLAIALLGALPLIKGSFLPLTLMAVATGSLLHWLHGERSIATLFILLPTATLLLLWQLAGQPLSALPDYFHMLAPVTSGYAEAMAVWGPPGHIFSYLLIGTGMLYAAGRATELPPLHRAIPLLTVGFFLFITFKAGFVRHEPWHLLIIGSGLVLLMLAVNSSGMTQASPVMALLTVLMFISMHSRTTGAAHPHPAPVASLRGIAEGKFAGLEERFTERLQQIGAEAALPLSTDDPLGIYVSDLRDPPEAAPLPKLAGTTDIYPHDLAELIASGNSWSPRPVPQSYAVYSPILARLNENHLRGQQAPDNIIFRVGPFIIDERFPTLEDGLSWPTLLSHYTPFRSDAKYLYLKKRVAPAGMNRTTVLQGSYQLGEKVTLPATNPMLFAEIELPPTLWGRLSMLLFKPDPLYIEVTLVNGENKAYRFIPSMARTGFVLSPLVESTVEFAQLATTTWPSAGHIHPLGPDAGATEFVDSLLDEMTFSHVQRRDGQLPALLRGKQISQIRIFPVHEGIRCRNRLQFCDKRTLSAGPGVSSPFWNSRYQLKLTALSLRPATSAPQ